MQKNKSLWKDLYLTFCIEEVLLFWRMSYFSSTNKLRTCFACYININLMGTEVSTATWSPGQNSSVFYYPNFTATASVHRRLISHDKPVKNLYIIMQSSTGWEHTVDSSPLNKGKNGEAKMRSIPLPKTAIKSSAIGCTTITTSLILDPPPCF